MWPLFCIVLFCAMVCNKDRLRFNWFFLSHRTNLCPYIEISSDKSEGCPGQPHTNWNPNVDDPLYWSASKTKQKRRCKHFFRKIRFTLVSIWCVLPLFAFPDQTLISTCFLFTSLKQHKNFFRANYLFNLDYSPSLLFFLLFLLTHTLILHCNNGALNKCMVFGSQKNCT